MDPVVLELKNFNYGTKVTDVAKAMGSMMKLHGKDWNSLYAVYAMPIVEVRSVTLYVKMRNISYFHRIRATPGVLTEGSEITFKFDNRKIRGTLLTRSEHFEEIVQLSESCKAYHLVASVPRGRLDLKDLLIRLDRHYKNGIDMISSISISKRKFFIAFKRGKALGQFLENDYFRRASERSESLFCVKRGPIIRQDLANRVKIDW